MYQNTCLYLRCATFLEIFFVVCFVRKGITLFALTNLKAQNHGDLTQDRSSARWFELGRSFLDAHCIVQ